MPQLKKVPARIARETRSLHPFSRRIIEVNAHHDGRFKATGRAILSAVAIRIGKGQREISNAELAGDVGIAGKNVPYWVGSLMRGGYLERHFAPGPHAATYRLRMPSEQEMARTIPSSRRSGHALNPPDAPAQDSDPGFDADRHREIGTRQGFRADGTDILLELRRNLATPMRRK